MSDRPLISLLQFVRRVAAPAALASAPDRRLVEDFVQCPDGPAFGAIVRRHGPMVFGVCRRIVPDTHSAEDAFQATFLILARKAGSLLRPEELASWLYGVARRTAMRAATVSARRVETQWTISEPDDPVREAIQSDQRRVLDEELARLPKKYRAPIILHHLEGQTTLETALALGCPHGTVLTRLARGRARLRSRLTRRGVTLSAFFSSAALADALPFALLESTVRIVALAATGGLTNVTVSASVSTLATGAMKAMFWTKCTLVIGMLAAVGGVGAGATWVALTRPGDQGLLVHHADNQLKTQQTNPSDFFEIPKFDDAKIDAFVGEKSGLSDEAKRIMKAKYKAVSSEVQERMNEFIAGRGSIENLLAATERLHFTEQGVASSFPEVRRTVSDNRYKLMKKIFDVCTERFQAGRIPLYTLKQCEYYALDAEYNVEMSKRTTRTRAG